MPTYYVSTEETIKRVRVIEAPTPEAARKAAENAVNAGREYDTYSSYKVTHMEEMEE